MHSTATSTRTQADFTIQPLPLTKRLLQVVFGLLLLNIASLCVQHVFQWNGPLASPFVRLFDLNTEGNVPTFFSSLLLLTAGALLLIIGKQAAERKDAYRWWLLSGVFVFLAVDESTMIHEAVTPILDSFRESNTGLGGYFRYIWVVPYVVAFIGLALYCAPFLWQLPTHIRNLFVLSGCIFVTGAAGLEIVEGHFDTVYGYNSIYKIILYTIEEVLEMGGVILFVYALLLHMAATKGSIQMSIQRAQAAHREEVPSAFMGARNPAIVSNKMIAYLKKDKANYPSLLIRRQLPLISNPAD